MSTTCANCGAEVGDASHCPRCGQAVLSPQAAPPEWRTDTAERAAVRPPVEPPPASIPGPARFPLYADESPDSFVDTAVHHAVAPLPPPPTTGMDVGNDADVSRGAGGAPPWLPWAIVALVMILVAVGGIWLLFAPGGDGSGTTNPPVRSTNATSTDGSDTPSTSVTSPAQSPSETTPVPTGDPVDVTGLATATAPRTAPPNEDVFGNRTTYAAANMLDGSPSTCWRMAGDGTGAELTFALASPTAMTRVGLINGYAKTADVGRRKLNWYVGNRRVLAAQWVFDDGTTLDQPLEETKAMQTVDLQTPVTTSTVTLRLVTVSAPGTGRSARDYTAISEVTLVGTPAA
jgi:hypothetical protein